MNCCYGSPFSFSNLRRKVSPIQNILLSSLFLGCLVLKISIDDEHNDIVFKFLHSKNRLYVAVLFHTFKELNFYLLFNSDHSKVFFVEVSLHLNPRKICFLQVALHLNQRKKEKVNLQKMRCLLF